MNYEPFWQWVNRDWRENPAGCSVEEAKEAYGLGIKSSGLPAIVQLWRQIRNEINTPECKEMDRILSENVPL